MRYQQSTLKASSVQLHAQRLLMKTLEREQPQPPKVPMKVVASVLILAACWQVSLTGACHLLKHQPSHRHVRQTLYACLPPRPRDLLTRLLDALRQTLPSELFARPLVLVLDMHQRPYYGKKGTRGSTRRQRKAGTRKSFTYATLAALDSWGGRYNVGLLPTRPHMRLTTLVERLLQQAQEMGLTISYLMMDKEFYCAEVIALLQKKKVPFLMPARRTGSKGEGNTHLFEATTEVGRHAYSWKARLRRLDFKTGKWHQRGTLTVHVEMWVANQPGKAERLVYVSWGLGKAWSPAQVVWAYKRRFGIEVQYRQLNQCLARTSSRNERLRLLLLGLALLLCNLWSYAHSEVLSKGPLGHRQRQLPVLRLALLVAAVSQHIASLFGGYLDEWTAQQTIPEELASFPA